MMQNVSSSRLVLGDEQGDLGAGKMEVSLT